MDYLKNKKSFLGELKSIFGHFHLLLSSDMGKIPKNCCFSINHPL